MHAIINYIGLLRFNCQQITGEVSYNGYKLDEFIPQKTSAYISQNDLHIAEMTVRETLDFSARCQGVGSREGNSSSSSLFQSEGYVKTPKGLLPTDPKSLSLSNEDEVIFC